MLDRKEEVSRLPTAIVLERLKGNNQELRQNRRVLARSCLTYVHAGNPKSEENASSLRYVGASSRDKSKKVRSNGGTRTASKGRDYGQPAAYDSQGRALYIRLSDGMLVYLQCYVKGYDKTSFSNF